MNSFFHTENSIENEAAHWTNFACEFSFISHLHGPLLDLPSLGPLIYHIVWAEEADKQLNRTSYFSSHFS